MTSRDTSGDAMAAMLAGDVSKPEGFPVTLTDAEAQIILNALRDADVALLAATNSRLREIACPARDARPAVITTWAMLSERIGKARA